MSWLDRILPAFTKRDYDRQYELGKTMGYILGYRQGCEDSAELERLKGSLAPGSPLMTALLMPVTHRRTGVLLPVAVRRVRRGFVRDGSGVESH